MLFSAAILVLLALFIHKLYRMHFPKNYAILQSWPGPRLYPVVGAVPHFFGFTPDEFTRLVKEWHKRWPSPLRSKLFGTYAIQLYRCDHVEQLFKSKANLKKSEAYNMMHSWLGQGLITSSGARWQRDRRTLTPAFHYQVLQDFFPIINKHALELVEHLRAQVRRGNTTLDVVEPFALMALDTICETSMGKQLDSLHKRDVPYTRAVLRFADIFLYRFIRPWLWNDWLMALTSRGRQLAADVRVMHRFTREVVEERAAKRRRNRAAAGKPVLIDIILAMYEKGQMSMAQVCEQMDAFMFAGYDTTATAIGWCCFCFALNPEYQQLAQDELDSVMGDDYTSLPTAEQLAEMELFERCVKESQRMYPSVPVISRELEQPLQIDDTYTVPAGEIVDAFIHSLHRDPEHFPDPDKFDPDRFLPDNVAHRHPFAYLPFAAGPRNCIGQKYAFNELKIVVYHLLRNFSISAVTTEEDVKCIWSITQKPKDKLLMKFRSRR